MHPFVLQSVRSVGLGAWAAGCVALAALCGCEKPMLYPSKGTLGAADVKELVERYKKAHRAKDVESLRAIFQPLRISNPGPWGDRMIGSAEESAPQLFELELVDATLVEFPEQDEERGVQFGWLRKRTPTAENGFSAVRLSMGVHDRPWKLMLIVRRPGEAKGPAMEVDVGLGVEEHQGRLYWTADNENMAAAAEWVRTGRLPEVYRPPGHLQDAEILRNLPKEIPKDWVRIIRERT